MILSTFTLSELFYIIVYTNPNYSTAQSSFPPLLKLANITPIHKKAWKHLKMTIGHLVYYQIFRKYMRDLCSRKCLNILSHSFKNFITVLGKVIMPSSTLWECLRNEDWQLKKKGTLLKNISKTFDSLFHKLLIANLNTCGFTIDSLKLVQDYLSNCKQRTKINSACSSWEEIYSIWSSTGVNFRALFIQHLFMGFIFHYEWRWCLKLCRL